MAHELGDSETPGIQAQVPWTSHRMRNASLFRILGCVIVGTGRQSQHTVDLLDFTGHHEGRRVLPAYSRADLMTAGTHDMVSHMKITITIADGLLEKARARATRERRTLREIIEEALRLQVAERGPRPPFRLKRRPFKGNGLQPGITEGDWEQLRDLIYRAGS